MLKRRAIQILAGIAAFAATLALPSPSQAAEVGYDLKSNRFSGTLPHGEPFQVTLWTKSGDSATLTYWPFFKSKRFGSNCVKVPAYATTFAARPIEVKEGNQKLAFDLPKLLPDQDYCFKLTVAHERSLDDAEKFRIAAAVQKSLDELARGPLDAGEFSPACKQELESRQDRTPPCAVAELFKKHLTLDLQVLRTNDPKAVKRSLPDVFQEALSADTDLLDALNSFHNQNLRHDTLRMALETARRHMSELRALLLKLDPGKPVHSPPEAKAEKAPKGPPPKPALPAISVVPRSALDRLRVVDDLLSRGKFSEAQTDFAKEFEGILKLSCASDQALPSERFKILSSPTDLAGTIDGLWSNTCDISDRLADINKDSKPEDLVKPSASAITSSDAFKRLFDSLTSVTIVEGPATAAASEGPRDKAFPFYASVDVGVAPIFFSGTTVNLAQYFALNMYFTAVDPDEPLLKRSPGRNPRANFLRRFSVSVGITTTGRQIENARNVSGIIGSQLPMVGLGLRLTRLVRLSGGVVLFNHEDPNPVVDKRHLRAAPYVALSLDVALFNWAKNLAK